MINEYDKTNKLISLAEKQQELINHYINEMSVIRGEISKDHVAMLNEINRNQKDITLTMLKTLAALNKTKDLVSTSLLITVIISSVISSLVFVFAFKFIAN